MGELLVIPSNIFYMVKMMHMINYPLGTKENTLENIHIYIEIQFKVWNE